ncbi:glycosyl hydrolase [Christiangramia fulva]|uniref:Glycosyl hydrolase n=1 Tax=Christiangramia fulva TaxID=2126553 RepID=A0A2R3Z5T2_9FLAO|nr:family 43 glycosylhydrolase [Christiangramia fulva]AVR45620.1 glycosyl hydrolase [Christiangramia fulva]
MRYHQKIVLLIICLILLSCGSGRSEADQVLNVAEKPLYRDPIFDGAADPVVIWNPAEKKHFMFYTNRRARADTLPGVSWVHGTKIGIAESQDGGASWEYKGTANINYPLLEDSEATYWAPDVIEHKGTYHMYLTIVPGIFEDWYHPRSIAHFTSDDLINWEYESSLELSSERVIDASVFKLPDGSWRMYYNNENDGKSIYYADSEDLYHWKDSGKKVVGDRGEGAKIFTWKGKNWMILDSWDGLSVYFSEDFENWKRQENNILKKPGTGKDDKVKGGHPDVVVQGDRAFIFYFTHPGRTPENQGKDNYETRRSSIQVAELHFEEGEITVDRNKEVRLNLKP